MSTYPFTAVVGSDDLGLALLLNAVPRGRRRAGARREGHREVDDGARASPRAARGRRGRRLPVLLRPRRSRPGLPRRAAPTPAPRPHARRRGWSSCRSAPPRTAWSASLDLERALAEGVTAYEPAARRRAPRHPLRRRGQPAPRPPGRPAARRRRDGPRVRRARGVSVAHAARVRARRHDEPRGGRAAAAAARPVRADRRGRRAAATALRAEVVRRRLAYDADPAAFAARWARRARGGCATDRRPRGRAVRTVRLRRRRAAADRRGLRRVRGGRHARRHRHGPRRRRPRGLARAAATVDRATTSGPPPGSRCRTAAAATRSTRPASTRSCSTRSWSDARGDRPGRPDGPARTRTDDGQARWRPATAARPRRRPHVGDETAGRRRTSADGSAEPGRSAAARTPTAGRGREHPRRRQRGVPDGRRRAAPPPSRSAPGCSRARHRRGRRRPAVAGPAPSTGGSRGVGTPATGPPTCTCRRPCARPRPHQRPAAGPAAPAASPRRPAPRRPQGREGNLVLFCVDASGSMAAPAADGAREDARCCRCCSTPTSGATRSAWSPSAAPAPSWRCRRPRRSRPAARRLETCRPAGGPRSPRGCCGARDVLRVERLRDPRRRAAAGRRHRRAGHRGPEPVAPRCRAAALLAADGVAAVVVDCEIGPRPAGPGRASSPSQLGAEYL